MAKKENKDVVNLTGKVPTTVGLFIALFFVLFVLPATAQEKIIIGLVPEMNVFAQVQRFQPLADYLSQETGIQVQLSILKRYSSIFEELQQQKIDAAFLGSFTAALAISQLGATPVARPVNLDNTSTYHGLIFARKDSNIRTAEDMRNTTMAFVERATTAGFIFPVAWLKEKGIADHTSYFKEFFFAGSHDAAIDAVMKKKADVGAAKNTIFDYYLARFPQAKNELWVIAKSKPVPSNALCVTQKVTRQNIAKLQASLISLDKSPKGREVLEKLRALKFVETQAADYAPVFDLAAEAGISLESFFKVEVRK